MKLDKDMLRAIGILGIVFGFFSGMCVEYTNKVIVPSQGMGVAVLVSSALMLLALGSLAFSESS